MIYCAVANYLLEAFLVETMVVGDALVVIGVLLAPLKPLLDDGGVKLDNRLGHLVGSGLFVVRLPHILQVW